MNETEIRRVIIAELGNIAPETDAGTIDPKADIREALDIDSMDFLNFITALHEKLKVDIPETDYRELLTLDKAVAYLTAHLGSIKG